MRVHHDYSQQPESRSFDVAAGVGELRVRLQWYPRSPGAPCGSVNAHMTLKDPAGAVFAESSAIYLDTTGQDCSDDEVDRKATLAAGTWTIVFEGTGDVQGWLDVTR